MINMKTLFKNHFDTNKISDDNIKKFTEIHIQRLSANNGGGEFTTMLTDITTAYTDYFGSITDEDVKFAVQQGLTITMNNVLAAFKKAVSQKEGLVRAHFSKDGAEYQEFFPLGVTEYSTATLANVEMLMNRFIEAAGKYTVPLGAALETEFQGYLTTFLAARSAQLAKIGEVAESKTDSTLKRDVVEVELTKNVHLIGAMFPGNVDRCMDFFDQSFLRDNNGNGDDEEGEGEGEGETP